MTRINGSLLSIAFAALLSTAAPCMAATFGTVVPIGGHSSDIALDESRGLLYIANFTANRIEVMSTSDYTIHTSMNVAPQPGALSISPDSKFLLIAHYGNVTPPDPSKNAVTLINLNDNTRQTFSTGDTPLALTFLADNLGYYALIVTSSGVIRFDPISGAMTVIATFADLGKQLPVATNTFPSQVILAQLATNSDQTVAYGIADDGNFQAFIQYDARKGALYAIGVIAVPKPLPRISVSADGTWAVVGQYKLDATARNLAQYPSITATNIGGVAVDSKSNLIYSQILTGPVGPNGTVTAASGGPPTMFVMDADNLLVKDNLLMPENITGRSILNAAADVLYSASDSGVMVFPVGRLNQQHRLVTAQSSVVARGNFCNRNVILQTLTITDPGGGTTDFQISSTIDGVTVSPAAGFTPATVQVRIDPTVFQNQNGTVTTQLNINSVSAVNLPPPVRLLINNRNPDQRGTFVDIPGNLTDILADPVRNRFYVVQQDHDQVLVFDSTTFAQIAALKTSNTPTQMAFSFDRKFLIVGHDDAQFAYVYDLDTLQATIPIEFPSGHYPRSIAESGKSILALSRNVTSTGGPGVIDRIDLAARKASYLPSLGIYTNSLHVGTVLTPAPNGGAIMAAAPDGNVMLYDANADTFTISRQDFKKLGGAYAASSYNSYVVGNNVLNASLVPQSTLETSSGSPSGFAFVDQGGFRTTASAASSPGVIERFDATQSTSTGKPTRLVEAPLVPGGIMSFIRSLAPLADRSAVMALTVSGFTVLPWNYDAAVAPPKITAVVNAADGKSPVAPGGLVSIYGQQMSPINMATQQIPLPTALSDSCLTVNGVAVPLLFVSSQQINGQIPVNVDGNATMTLRTPGGISDNFNFTILPAAPSIFRTGVAGPESGLATVTRGDNGQLITPTNPIHPNDTIVIWATGLGRTSPPIDSGMPAPSDPLPSAVIPPAVSLGGTPLNVTYAGLVPGSVGLYQINATVPAKVPNGLDIALQVNQGGSTTTLSVRVVN